MDGEKDRSVGAAKGGEGKSTDGRNARRERSMLLGAGDGAHADEEEKTMPGRNGVPELPTRAARARADARAEEFGGRESVTNTCGRAVGERIGV